MTSTAAFESWIAKARAVPIEREIERRGIKLKRSGPELIGPCPHCGGDDRFGVNIAKQIWNCRGCGKGGDIIDLVQHLDGVDFIAAGTTLAGERPQAKPNGNGKDYAAAEPKQIPAAKYKYEDEAGNLAFGVVRVEYQNADGSFLETKDGKRKKTYRQGRPDPEQLGKWIRNVDGVAVVPYRLPELIEAIGNGHFVVVVEGEAKVDLLRSWNVPATCCAGGAEKWKTEHSAFLRGADVVILPDNDIAGRKHGDVVSASLQGIAASVRVLELPDLPPKGDIIDWDKAGGTVEQLHDLIEHEAKPWSPRTDSSADSGDGDAGSQQQQKPTVKILSSAEFIRSYVPPDYLIDGLLQRQFFYSFTGKTGGGKTAIALTFSASVALGRAMDGRECSPGRVLYLAGENPVDILQRWIAMSQHMDFDGNTIDVHFIPGVFTVSDMADCIAEQVNALGGVSLVVIDTTAAYFEGDDENNNVQAGKYARMQRSLVNLLGGPTVLALCHPVKNATEDNLIPRGGGAYLNEADGNLTTQNNSGVAELHWQGKYRGADFAPISFQLRTVTHEQLRDSKGRLIPTVVACHLSEAGEKELKTIARSNEDKLLVILATNRGASLADLAKLGEWLKRDGGPNRTLVWRLIQGLKRAKLVAEGRNGLELTEAGRKASKPPKEATERHHVTGQSAP